MTNRIEVLDLGTIHLDSSFLVLGDNPGVKRMVPAYAFLIRTPDGCVLVDTGFRSPEIMRRVGMKASISEEQDLLKHLGRLGLSPSTIGCIVHTHLHIDHAGQDDIFPMDVPVLVDRDEMAFSVCGIGGYQPEDTKHLVDRLHTHGAMKFLDANRTGGETIARGVRCVPAHAHTPGSLIVEVETSDGLCAICGDIVYDAERQINTGRTAKTLDEPRVSGNIAGDKLGEIAAMKMLLERYDVLMPSHCSPVRVRRGFVASSVHCVTNCETF